MMFRPITALVCATIVFAQDPPRPDTAGKPLSLKAERKIDFETTEGTWISVDVSPDGRTLLLELDGDIYTLPIEGGEAKAVLTGMAFESQPRWSPDGKRIAFLSDRNGAENLWISNPDGTAAKPLSKERQGKFASPAWTPDGRFVMVSRSTPTSGTHEIWMYSVSGGSGVQITKATPAGAPASPPTPPAQRLNSMGAAVSPDGRYVYYARRNGTFTYNANFPLWQIVRKDRDTAEEDVITSENGSAFRPVLSPDGKLLVYGTRYETETGLRVRTLATGEDKWLKYPVQRDDQESAASRDVLPGYSFTPDGSSIIVCYGGKLHRVDVPSGKDTVIPFHARVSLDLGPLLDFQDTIDERPVHSRLIMGAMPSPDGSKIAFSALGHLYVVPASGGTPVRVTKAEVREYQPAWSPDGRTIAYVTWTGTSGHIWKVAAEGQGTPQQVTTVSGFYREPVWSPDGSLVIALRGSDRSRLTLEAEFGAPQSGLDVVSVPSAGGDVTLIAPSRGLGRPHFGNVKDRIFLYSRLGLTSLRFDGSDSRVHLKVTGNTNRGPEPPPASDVRISPDGLYALAHADTQLYLIQIGRAGDSATVNLSQPSLPVRKLTDIGADFFSWSDGGKSITWTVGSAFFRLPLASVDFDDPKQKLAPVETAITVEVPRHRPSGTVVLRGAKVITMKGEETIASADIVITGNRIQGVGKQGSVGIPPNAKIIDVRGHTIMPGIIDVHAHWTEVRRGVLDPDNTWPLFANLAYGVTTGRDPQTSTNDMFAYQDLVEAGEIIGPRAFNTGPGVFANSNFQSFEEARSTVSRYRKYYRTNTLKSYVVGNRQQRQWMIEACKELKMMPTTEGSLDLKLDFTHAIDGFSGNEHALPIVPLYDDVVNVFAKSGITYTPTLLVAYGGPWAENFFYETTEVYGDPKLRRFLPQNVLYQKSTRRPWFREDEHVFPKLAESAGRILKAGGRLGIGGHGQLQGIQCHWEMWALKTGGLSNFDVLRTATLNGAHAIGYEKDLGSIEVGKLADLIVLKKDPLVDIHNTASIQYVMKDGELFEGDTLDQIWPQKKALKPLWWWNDAPVKK